MHPLYTAPEVYDRRARYTREAAAARLRGEARRARRLNRPLSGRHRGLRRGGRG